MADKTITVIPARTRVGSRKQMTEERPKLRVAAYCRVSTDHDEQETSYEAQVAHYKEVIENNHEWQLAGIYADDGISGTNTKKRDEFNRMIEDCRASKIDMIITKSISRFARNTLDCLQYIRELKEKNIAVFFEKENINTLDAKGEVLLTIMASLAQQESQSLSQNVKLGLQFRYQAGKVQVNHNRFLGYTKDKDGNLVIEPEEAEIVRRIYREYLEGASTNKIAKGLEADGIKTAAGSSIWRTSTLLTILTNEKYIGDALLQKTYTVDFLTKKRVVNDGIMPQYYIENDHPAIISRETFMKVQEEKRRRSRMACGPDGRRRNYSSKYALSTIVFCAHCQDRFQRAVWYRHGSKTAVWRCGTRMQKGPYACSARTVPEEALHEVVVRAVNDLVNNPDFFIPALQENIRSVLENNSKDAVEEIESRVLEVQRELLKRANEKQDYYDLADELSKLREKKNELLRQEANKDSVRERMEEIVTWLKKEPKEVTEYSESLVRRMIEKVTVDDDLFVVEFKSGVEITVMDKRVSALRADTVKDMVWMPSYEGEEDQKPLEPEDEA